MTTVDIAKDTTRGLHPGRRRASSSGMTLIEIMVVITILGLIATAVSLAVLAEYNRAQRKRVCLDIQTIGGALKLYYSQNGKYPDTSEGLPVLVSTQHIETLPKDPWGHDYTYSLEGAGRYGRQHGRDGAPGGEGDDADVLEALRSATIATAAEATSGFGTGLVLPELKASSPA